MLNRNPAYQEALDTQESTLTDSIYRHLADRLVAGRFAPGDKLSLRSVSEALGVSMMPVREAVSRLAAEGALEVLPKKAVTVPLMRATQFRDITRVRTVIEGTAAGMASQSRDPALLAEIERTELVFRMLGQKRNPDLAQAVAANQAFHFAIYRAAGSAELLAIIERLWLRVGPIINLDLRENPERLALGEAVRHHAATLKAIKSGDEAGARTAIAADIKGASDFILYKGRLPEHPT